MDKNKVRFYYDSISNQNDLYYDKCVLNWE